MSIKGNWSGTSAFNLELALKESREWIEAVTVTKFASDDFQASLKNGVLLCKLINQIKPGIVPKINAQTTEFAQRENLSNFVKAAKQLGLRDTQLFESNDLFEAKRIRNVAISLYWLGRAARGVASYKGPQLNLLAFQKMNCSACKKPITDNNYLATLTQQWHTSCAVCCQCHCNLDPKNPFYMERNNIWCPNCMVGATSVGVKSTPHSGGKGHQHGKNDNECVGCHGNLNDGYVPDEKDESQKYCTKCICDLCHNPLIGNFNIVNGQKVCDECSCSSCGVPLKDGFFEEGISRYCGPCSKSHQQQKQSSPSSPSQGHGHTHGHSHSHSPTSSTSSTSPSNSSNGCKVCDKPLTSKPKKGNDRDKFCPPHEKERCCGGCDKEIVGQSLEAFDKAYHPSCFNCDKCHKTIKPGETLKKSPQGNPRCGPCASSSSPSAPQCRSCDKQLRGEYVDIDGEPYCEPCADELDRITQQHSHPSTANTTPQQSGFITSGWGPNDKCSGCSKSLSGQVAKVYDQYWHSGCFKCDQCKVGLTTGYFQHDRKPFCKPCHNRIEESSSEKCGKCSKSIVSGQIIKAGNKSWHKECFSCTTCNKVIGDGSTFTRFSKPYCRGCWDKEKAICCKCRNQIQGEVMETAEGKMYCTKCVPAPTTTTIYGDRTPGFTIDPRSGKKTWRT